MPKDNKQGETKLRRFMDSIFSKIRNAPLTQKQRGSALADIKSIIHLETALTTSNDTDGLTASSANASVDISRLKVIIDGTLAKYLIDGKINAINHLNQIVKQTEDQIQKHAQLNDSAKFFAYRLLEEAQAKVTNQIQATKDFAGLKKVQEAGSVKLKHTLNSKILQGLKTFKVVTQRIQAIIKDLTALSTADHDKINNQIKKCNTDVSVDLRSSTDQDSVYKILRKSEDQLLKVGLAAIIKHYKTRLYTQSLNLSLQQISKLGNQFQQASIQLKRKFNGYAYQIMKKLQLLETFVKKEDALIYGQQIDQMIYTVKLQIQNLNQFPPATTHQILSQLTTLGHQIRQNNKKSTSLHSVQATLQQSLHQQLHYFMQTLIQKRISQVRNQVEDSHLSSQDKQSAVRRLSRVAKDAKDAQNSYQNSLQLVQGTQKQILAQNKDVNLKLLDGINRSIQGQLSGLSASNTVKQDLQNRVNSVKSKINQADQIDVVDHMEQLFENYIYQKLCKLSSNVDPLKAKYLELIQQKVDNAHVQMTAVVSQADFRQIILDGLDRMVNDQLLRIVQSHNPGDIKQQVSGIDGQIKHYISQVLNKAKHRGVQDITYYAHDVYHQSLVYTSADKIRLKLGQLRFKTTAKINNAGDLLHAEYAKQSGRAKLNAVLDKIIESIDSTKAKAHQQIRSRQKTIIKHLDNQQFTTNDKLVLMNRLMKVVNDAHQTINENLDSDIKDQVKGSQKELTVLLKQIYEYILNQSISRVTAIVQKMTHLPSSAQTQVRQALLSVKRRINKEIQVSNERALPKIIPMIKSQLHRVVIDSIAQDPLKQPALHNMVRLANAVTDDIKAVKKPKVRKVMKARFDKLVQSIDKRFIQCTDRDAQAVADKAEKQLKAFSLKVGNNVQIKRFNTATQQIEKKIKRLTLLSSSDLKLITTDLNRSYHKTIYELTHASDLIQCKRNVRNGILQAKAILAQATQKNGQKEKFYQKLEEKIKYAKSQINNLENLQTSDKKDVDKLLRQILDQAHQKLQQPLSGQAIVTTEKHYADLIQKIVNDMTSINVMQVAFQSANHQVMHSKLSEEQKQVALKQMQKIIHEGLKSQIHPVHQSDVSGSQSSAASKPSTSKHKPKQKHDHHRNDDHQSHSHHHTPGQQTDARDQSERKHNSNFIHSLIKAFKSFFTWLRVDVIEALF